MQALSYLRVLTFDSASFQRVAHTHQQMVAAQRRGDASGSYAGGMIMKVRDQEEMEDSGGGVVINGTRYTNPSRINHRSGW